MKGQAETQESGAETLDAMFPLRMVIVGFLSCCIRTGVVQSHTKGNTEVSVNIVNLNIRFKESSCCM